MSCYFIVSIQTHASLLSSGHYACILLVSGAVVHTIQHEFSPANPNPHSNSGIMTPSSSNDTASHASAAGSNDTITPDQPQEQSKQLLAYINQSPTADDSLYGRLANQPETGDLQGRIAFHTARAQEAIDSYDEQSRSRGP